MKDIMSKLQKVLTIEELKALNVGIKKMVKTKTEANITKIKKEYETKAQSLINESKETLEAEQNDIIVTLVEEEVATQMNAETSKQLKLIKENKKLKAIIKTLNKSIKDKDQSMKIQKNRITSLQETTSEKEVVNESMVYGGVNINEVVGLVESSTTTMSRLEKNLNNDDLGGNGIVGILGSIKNL